jgi:CspA family cold shock protein
MAEGTIKRKVDRGFGFITTANGTELFFHMSAVGGTTFEELQLGQRVRRGGAPMNRFTSTQPRAIARHAPTRGAA